MTYYVEMVKAGTPLKAEGAVFTTEEHAVSYQKAFNETTASFAGYAYGIGRTWPFHTWVVFQGEPEPTSNEWGEVSP